MTEGYPIGLIAPIDLSLSWPSDFCDGQRWREDNSRDLRLWRRHYGSRMLVHSIRGVRQKPWQQVDCSWHGFGQKYVVTTLLFNSFNPINPGIKECERSADLISECYADLNVDAKSIKNGFGQTILKCGLRMKSGVRRFLDHLHEHNIEMAIATSGPKLWFHYFRQATEGFPEHYFSHVLWGEDNPEVKANKPAPDIFVICAKQFKTPMKSIRNCVIFEDSFAGISGAIASGMKAVLINDSIGPQFDPIRHQISAIADSFDNFRPESVGLPPYKWH